MKIKDFKRILRPLGATNIINKSHYHDAIIQMVPPDYGHYIKFIQKYKVYLTHTNYTYELHDQETKEAEWDFTNY